MKQYNHHLNFLPLLAKKEHQLRYRHACRDCIVGVTVEAGKVPKCQLLTTIGNPVASWGVYDLDDNLIISPQANAWRKYEESSTGKMWVRYDRTLWAGSGAICGQYYLKVTMQNGTVYYSEVFESRNFNDKTDWHKIEIASNGGDYGDYLFFGGWKQEMYFKGYIDIQANVQDASDLQNTRSQTVREFDSIKTRRVMQIPFFQDYLQGAFKAMEEDKLSVTISDLVTNTKITGSHILVNFEPSPEGCYLLCNFSWQDTESVYRGWNESAVITSVDNTPISTGG